MPKRKPSSHFAKQAQEAYELSLAGFSYRQIAEEMGVSLATVQRRLELYVKDRVHPKADEYRARQIDRAQIYIRSLWSQVLAGDPKSIAQAIRTEERIAKLLGLDSATQFKVEMEEIDPFKNRIGALTTLGKIFRDSQKDSSEIDKQIAELEQAKAEGKPLPPRVRRPTPDWYLENERKKEEARQAARNTPADEFRNDATFAAHEVQEEAITLADWDKENLQPKDSPRPRRQSKPAPYNPLLRDSDD